MNDRWTNITLQGAVILLLPLATLQCLSLPVKADQHASVITCASDFEDVKINGTLTRRDSGHPINGDEKIELGEHGYLCFQDPNGAMVRLSRYGKLNYGRRSGGRLNLHLISGDLWVKDPRGVLRIETPVGLVTSKGAVFSLEVHEFTIVEIQVVEGKIALTGKYASDLGPGDYFNNFGNRRKRFKGDDLKRMKMRADSHVVLEDRLIRASLEQAQPDAIKKARLQAIKRARDDIQARMGRLNLKSKRSISDFYNEWSTVYLNDGPRIRGATIRFETGVLVHSEQGPEFVEIARIKSFLWYGWYD